MKKNINGDYLKYKPTWDVEHSFWKSEQIIKILKRNKIFPNSILEVGCGAGEILVQLQKQLDKNITYIGYEISPQAYQFCKSKENKKLKFRLKDITKEENHYSDLLLIIDVLEHVENYISFLKKIKPQSKYKIFHIPLEMTVKNILVPRTFEEKRKQSGHIHYFSKETALETLRDCNYQIIDYFFTNALLAFPSRGFKGRLQNMCRKLSYPINKNLAVKIFGGCSLMVLTK